MSAQSDAWVHAWGLSALVGIGVGGGLAYFVARFGVHEEAPDSPPPQPSPQTESEPQPKPEAGQDTQES